MTRTKPGKNTGAFAQGQLALFDALFFTYGLRADWNPSFGENAKVKPGRYGVSYARDIETPLGAISTKLRGSYGRSIRPPIPELTEAITAEEVGFGNDLLSQFGPVDYVLANPDLSAEHQQGGEGGVELYFGSRGSLVVTRYNQTVDNLITQLWRVDSARSLEPVAPLTTNCSSYDFINFFDTEGHCYFYQFQNLNVGSIRNQGWEMQGSVNIGPFTTRGTYSWVKSRVIGVTARYKSLASGVIAFEPGRPFDYVPEHTWALGVTYAKSRSTLSLNLNGLGDRYVGANDLNLALSSSNRFQANRPRMSISFDHRPLGPGYAMADLNATHRFTSRVDALLQITNLTDYYQNDYDASYATMGRQSRVGFRLRM